MLKDHRRVLLYSLLLLVAMVLVFVGVGRHPPALAPETTFAPIGRVDRAMYDAIDDIRNVVFSTAARALNVIGGGIVTIPLRVAVAVWLAWRRRWRAFAAWALTWAMAEILLSTAKAFFHRGRPLVAPAGFAFPSGHAVAGAATAVALVLVLLPAGPNRRKWEAVAVAFACLMAMSRVYLDAHWLSDVVAGVLLGTGVALASAALVTQIRDVAMRRAPPAYPTGAG